MSPISSVMSRCRSGRSTASTGRRPTTRSPAHSTATVSTTRCAKHWPRYITPANATVFSISIWDDFKLINDRYGHAAGDLALTGLCRRIESCVRKGDQLARLGGDEFAVLLKHCNAAEAHVIAEEIRKAVETFQLTHQADALGGVGVSIGIAVLHPDTPDAWHTVDAADQALLSGQARRQEPDPPVGLSSQRKPALYPLYR
jgi:diguanylate cyclase (GGDEF)-like protein